MKNYLEENLLIKVKNYDENQIQILFKNCKESLIVSRLIFKEDISNLWTIVSSYYAMYYMSKAALYKMGYKVGDKISHKITADALIIFARDKLKKSLLESYEEIKEDALELAGIKADNLIENFDFERIKRSKFQYNLSKNIIKSKAETSLKRAEEFIFEIKKIT